MTCPDVGKINLVDCQSRQFPLAVTDRSSGLQIVVKQSTINAIKEHGEGSLNAEICGVLVGTLCKDNDGPFVWVEASIPGHHANNEVGNVTFTAETWTYIQTELDRDYPTKNIVGWYHTHPAFGIFLSNMDMFIHEHFFNLPWQVAYVVDPIRSEEGWFAWHNGKISSAKALVEPDKSMKDYYPVTPVQDTSAVTQYSEESCEQIRLLKKQRLYAVVLALCLAIILAICLMLRFIPGFPDSVTGMKSSVNSNKGDVSQYNDLPSAGTTGDTTIKEEE